VVDPEDRKLFSYSDAGFHEADTLRLPEYQFILNAKDVFGRSDSRSR